MNRKHIIISIVILVLVAVGTYLLIRSINSNQEIDINSNLTLGKEDIVVKLFLYEEEAQVQNSEYLERWEDSLEDEFGINLKFNYIINPVIQGEYYSSDLNKEIIEKYSGFDGLLYVKDFSQLEYLVNNDVIISLDSLLNKENSPIFLTEDDINNYKIQNHIWAIPTTNNYSVYGRLYNSNFVSQLPEGGFSDVFELLSFVRELKEENPEIYFCTYSIETFFFDFMDIFLAFDLYPSDDLQIGYNPKTQLYEDIILNPRFIEAMYFISLLKEEDLIISRPELYSLATNQSNGFVNPFDLLISEYSAVNTSNFGSYIVSYYFHSLNNEKSVISKLDKGAWAVLKNTEEPNMIINEFTNKVWNNEMARISYNFGIENYNYTVDSKKVDLKNIKEEMNPEIYPFISNTYILNKYSERIITKNNSMFVIDDFELAMKEYDSLPEGLKYRINSGISNITISKMEIKELLNEFLTSVLEKHESIQSAVDEYTVKVKNLDVYNEIVELNN